jgi:hypothetical protein
MPFCTPKASDLVLVTHSDTQVHSSTELKRASISVFLTVGFPFDDELEYLHVNPSGKGWGIGPRGSGLGIRDQLSATGYRLATCCY